MTKIERAIKALNELADALDALPIGLQPQVAIFNVPKYNTEQLRHAAEVLEAHQRNMEEANEPAPE